jgi:hypothetical protein
MNNYLQIKKQVKFTKNGGEQMFTIIMPVSEAIATNILLKKQVILVTTFTDYFEQEIVVLKIMDASVLN